MVFSVERRPGRVLLTRPRAQAEATATTLAGEGVPALISPLTRIVPRALPPVPQGCQAVLFTSLNGVEAAGALPRDLPALCVGNRTAAGARDAGFAAESADGSAQDLAALVQTRLSPRSGPLYHLCAAQTDGRLAAALRDAGYTVVEAVGYDAEPQPLSAEAHAALEAGEIAAVPLYSPRAGQLFSEAVRSGWQLQHCTAIAISPGAAEAVAALPFGQSITAQAPSGAAMIRLILQTVRPELGCAAT